MNRFSQWSLVAVVVSITLYCSLHEYDVYYYQKGVEKAKSDREKADKSNITHTFAALTNGLVVGGGGTGKPVELQSGSTIAMVDNGYVYLPSCFHVHLSKVDDSHYLMDSRNDCGREIRDVYVLVKFMDTKGRRIGVGNWQAHYVAKGERLYKTLPAPDDVKGFSKVQVRLITDDALEAAK